MKLGKDTDKPEFTNTTYFAMIFSCGVAVGLFVYGTAEPMYHCESTPFANLIAAVMMQ